MRLPFPPVESTTCMTRTEEWSSPSSPQTRGEHTTCVTLSKIAGALGSSNGMESISWSLQMLIFVVTEVGEGGCIRLSTREHGGKGKVPFDGGGGLAGGGCVSGRSGVVSMRGSAWDWVGGAAASRNVVG
jgi:hypothetical protein